MTECKAAYIFYSYFYSFVFACVKFIIKTNVYPSREDKIPAEVLVAEKFESEVMAKIRSGIKVKRKEGELTLCKCRNGGKGKACIPHLHHHKTQLKFCSSQASTSCYFMSIWATRHEEKRTQRELRHKVRAQCVSRVCKCVKCRVKCKTMKMNSNFATSVICYGKKHRQRTHRAIASQ